jgi:hypothetical protein
MKRSGAPTRLDTLAARMCHRPMAVGGVIVGGSYEFHTWGEHESPVFSFLASDMSRAAALVRDMFVEFDVRLDRTGRLAYHLGVPDRQFEPTGIPVQPADLPRVAEATAALRTCPARIADGRGAVISLDRFTADLPHDWSGTYARALHDFQGGRPEQAIATLHPFALDSHVPAVHHLLGRSLRARGDLGAAVPHLLEGVRHASASHGDKLLPAAAGILADLGTVFKKLGMTGKAAHCLLHALHLRPNHPGALLTFATLFPATDALHIYALGRVLAIGNQTERVRECAEGLAHTTSTPVAEILRQAEAAAVRVELATWPLARADLGLRRSFFEGLDRLGMRSSGHSTAEDSLLATESDSGRAARPWWKFW